MNHADNSNKQQQYTINMGYAVVHLEKGKGADSGMSAHIERTTHPANADKKRTHLNRELIQFPAGIKNRTQAITHRLETAGIKRKIAANQVRAIRVLLTGTNEDMKRIEHEGNLDEWCKDNLNWLCETYGEKNVVSAVLHMDEKTPHIHATIIPIVTSERRKAKREQQEGKKQYRKKNPQAARLCADDVMTRANLKHYQNTYAEAMNKYGLKRGIDGSEARHASTSEYYKELINQQESIQDNIGNLLQQEKGAQEQLKQVKKEINTEKLKGAAVNVTTNIVEGISSALGSGKVKRLEQENTQLKQQLSVSKQRIVAEQQEVIKWDTKRKNEIQALKEKHSREISGYENKLHEISTYFPQVKIMTPIVNQCREIGLTEDTAVKLVNFYPVQFSGKLYSKEHNRFFETENSTISVEQLPQHNGKFCLCINGISILDWFKEKFQELKQLLGISQEEERPYRGMKM